MCIQTYKIIIQTQTYANLNDGLDEDDVYFPQKRTSQKGPGAYLSEERLRSHTVQNDRVCKKLKLTSDKEKELDLERIMKDSDILPDIVHNRPVAHTDNGDISDCE